MQTSNYITKDKAVQLKSHLDSLVGLDKLQLAKRYKNQLMENTISEEHCFESYFSEFFSIINFKDSFALNLT